MAIEDLSRPFISPGIPPRVFRRDEEEEEPRSAVRQAGGAIMKVLDLLNRPLYGLMGGIDAGVRGKNPLAGAARGIRGEEKKTASSVLETLGLPELGGVNTPLGRITGRGALGFGIDMFADPLKLSKLLRAKGAVGRKATGVGLIDDAAKAKKLNIADNLTGSQIQDLGRSQKQVAERAVTGVGQKQSAIDAFKKGAGEVDTNNMSLDQLMNMSADKAARKVAGVTEDVISTPGAAKRGSAIGAKTRETQQVVDPAQPSALSMSKDRPRIDIGGSATSRPYGREYDELVDRFKPDSPAYKMMGGKKAAQVQSWDDVAQNANLNDLNKFLSHTNRTPELIQAGKAFRNSLNAEIEELLKALDAATTPSAKAMIQDYIDTLRAQELDVLTKMKEAGSDLGRAFNYLKRVTNELMTPQTAMERQVMKNIKDFPDPEAVLEYVRKFDKNDIDGMAVFMDTVAKHRKYATTDFVESVWYNSILSGTPTQIVSPLGNQIKSSWHLLTKPLAVGVDAVASKLTGRPREVFMEEVLPATTAFYAGFPAGIRRAMHVAAKKGLRETDIANMKLPKARPSNAIVGALENFISIPSKMLTMGDEFFRGMNSNMVATELATSAAIKKGLVKGSDEFAKAVQEGLQDPSILKQAADKATEMLFMNVTKESSAATGLRNLIQIDLGKLGVVKPLTFIFPFINTPINVAKFGIQASPVGLLNTLSKAGKMAPRDFAEKTATGLMGSGLLTYFALKVNSGDITGRVPRDKQERDAFYAQGKQPWSIRIGDKWMPYQKLEPLNTVFATIANWHDAFTHKGDAPMPEKIQEFSLAFARGFADQTFMQGIGSLMDAMEDPERYSGAFLGNLATGFMPYSSFIGNIARAQDPLQRRPETLPDYFKARIPGLRQELAPIESEFEPGGMAQRKYSAAAQFLPIRVTEQDKNMERASDAVLTQRYLKGARQLSRNSIRQLKKRYPDRNWQPLFDAIDAKEDREKDMQKLLMQRAS